MFILCFNIEPILGMKKILSKGRGGGDEGEKNIKWGLAIGGSLQNSQWVGGTNLLHTG